MQRLAELLRATSKKLARAASAVGKWITGSDRKLTVIYDGECEMCRRSTRWIQAFDWAEQVRLVDFTRVEPASIHPALTLDACLHAMQVLDDSAPGSPPRAGFAGIKLLCRRLRLLWPAAALFALPGASWLGPRLYRRIAARRARHARCATGRCSIHAPRKQP